MAYYTTLKINGTQINYDVERIKVKNSISENNTAGTFEIHMENTDGRNTNLYSIGDSVSIKSNVDTTLNDGTFPLVFPFTFGIKNIISLISGKISEVSYKGKGSVQEKLILRGRDNTAILQDSTVQPAVFKSQTVQTIVNTIMADNIPNVTTNNVNPPNITLDSRRYNHQPVFDALRELARASNCYFFVDSDLDLHFVEKGSVSSSLRFDNTNITSSEFRDADIELANHVWVYGSRRLTGWRNDFTANGGSVYTLDYKPHNTKVYVAGSTTPKVGGVFEFVVGEVGSPTQYLVDFDNAKVVFVSGTLAGDNIPVSGTDTFNIQYERESPIAKFGIDRASFAKYGKKETVIVDKNITDPNEAVDRLKDTLLERSSPVKQGTLMVNDIVDISPGQVATINLPNENVNEANYEIFEVVYEIDRVNELGNNLTRVKANKRIIGITDTIKQLYLDMRQSQAEDATSTDTLTRLESAVGEFPLQREWFIKTRTIGDSFVLGHSVNGKLGSPQIGTSGGQINLGSSTAGAFSIVKSGGNF